MKDSLYQDPTVSQSCRLERLSWTEIAELQKKTNCLLVPVGATEQHGPHLPINTDSVIAEKVCDYASGKTGVPVLPVMAYSVSAGHTTKWTGTFSMSHATFIEAIKDLVGFAVETGWRRVVLLNAHMGNDASLRVAVDVLRVKYLGQLQIVVVNSFTLSDEIWQYFISDAADLHANKGETDLMLHLAPDTVRMEVVEDDPDRTTATVFSYPVSQTSLNGVTGNPSEGSAAQGAWLFEMMGEALASLLERALEEEPPLPKSAWEGTGFSF
ncbi:creatininase family protein [Roseibacillus persicicus]|uniref:Creatininase n=1 Tax=Roseibacillus persicicus TaxID=454148 RepID=A0A918TP25_9BACT|nr:creatininase family protein [Roseibacillus persicicus]MDQ8191535.1 creatininase family protein [Roseibacillus persicicus]GHC57231.1 creatininase [Roseibacillus persicicus]